MLRWIAAVVYLALAVYLYKRFSQKKRQERYEVNCAQLQNEVNALARCMKDLESLDSLIVDIRLCKPEEVMRNFRMEWQSASGQSHHFDFMLDGQGESSAYMLNMAEAERDALNQEILQRVFDLYKVAVLLAGDGEKP